MPIGENDIKPGAVYILESYAYVQVLSVDRTSVIYRVRRLNFTARATIARKSMSPAQFAKRARAEVNGEYFPGFTDLRGYRYQRSKREEASLKDHLSRRAPHRPFVTG